MATVNDPIIYAINFYALKAAVAGTGTFTTITAPTATITR
jgi:polysaccharide export outer membrane protein